MSRNRWTQPFRTVYWLTCILISPALLQAQETVSVRIQPHAEAFLPPLALDVLVESDGRVVGSLGALDTVSELTLKRSTLTELPDRTLEARYEAVLVRKASTGQPLLSDVHVLLHHSVKTQTSEAGSLIADVRTLPAWAKTSTSHDSRETGNAAPNVSRGGDGGDLDIIVWDVVGVTGSSNEPFGLVFVPSSPNERLRGEPAFLFNHPGPGEDLVAQLPTSLGTDFEEVLTVYSGQTTEAQIRIKIKHPS